MSFKRKDFKLLLDVLITMVSIYFSIIVFPELMGGSTFELIFGMCTMGAIVVIWSNLLIEVVLKIKQSRRK